jgi:imidazolonepropionase-like amidohydrolase
LLAGGVVAPGLVDAFVEATFAAKGGLLAMSEENRPHAEVKSRFTGGFTESSYKFD